MKFETTNAEEKWETTKLREVINLFAGAIKGQKTSGLMCSSS
jgi:hypothetical protein